MIRDLSNLSSHSFDVIIIGGGITGACIAWDATLRGLKVALFEANDFGSKTSSNSLKTVHGGLRYLQDGNLRLVRKMIKERRALMRIAPHLVRPLPVLMPTYKDKLVHRKLVLGSAIKINDWLSADRNIGIHQDRHLLSGRILSKDETLEILPGLAKNNPTGAVQWYDAQMTNTERLVLAFIQSARERGAIVANYASVKQVHVENRSTTGVSVEDKVTGHTYRIASRAVVNAAGPWIDRILESASIPSKLPRFELSTAMNLVTRQIINDYAVGINSTYQHVAADGSTTSRQRMLFVAPWRDYSLVGTIHETFHGGADEKWVTEKKVNDLIEEVNRAYPHAQLSRADVKLVHRGFLPCHAEEKEKGDVQLLREGYVINHKEIDDINGLISSIGVKYTTGRYLAEKTVDTLVGVLKKPLSGCITQKTPVTGGAFENLRQLQENLKWPSAMTTEQARRICCSYGSISSDLLKQISDEEEELTFLGKNGILPSEIRYAIRLEMAIHLEDVIFRRTELGSAEIPSDGVLEAVAQVMKKDLGWSQEQAFNEIDRVKQRFEIEQKDINVSIS